jgi:long-chain acyl-CoA synthetase
VKNCLVAHSFRHEDVHLLVVPMFHCTPLYSLLPSSAYLGSTIVIAPRPHIGEVAKLVQEHRVTTFIGVPTLFHFLVTMRDFGRYDFSSLKTISYAGATMPVQTIQRLKERLPWVELRNFFGLTETTSVTHVLPGPDALERPDSVGKVLPDVGAMIADNNGNPLPPGQIGELCFRTENVVTGYWNRPGMLEESTRDGWFHTGDLAYVDEDGYLYLRGRSKDMIIVGGENVYANEVEGVIMSHGKVLECAVVGVEATGVRAYLGELVKAVVVPEEGADLSEADVKRHCAQHLASYKVPQIVEFRSELPRNPSGKVLKRQLR